MSDQDIAELRLENKKLQVVVDMLNKRVSSLETELNDVNKTAYPLKDITLEKVEEVKKELKELEVNKEAVSKILKNIKDIFSEINSRYASIKKIEFLKQSFDKSSKKLEIDFQLLKNELKKKADTKKTDKKLNSLKSKIEKIKKRKRGLFK